MKTLLVFRHAKSNQGHKALDDHERPLNKRGNKTAPLMGQWLAQQHAVPDLILSSTAKRAVSTAEQTAVAMGYEGEICYDKNLYLAPPNVCLQAVRSHAKAHTRVMIVGHNPGLQALIRAMTGVDRALPTAGLADIHLELDAWLDLTSHTTGQLSHFWLPRELFP